MSHRVITGDALVELPKLADALDLSDACIVADPPYGTGGWRRTVAGAGDDPSGSLIVEDWDEGATGWLHALPASVPVLTFWPVGRACQFLAAATASGRTKHRALYMRKPDAKPTVGGRVRWSVEPIWVLSADGFCLYGGDDVCDEMLEATTPRLGRDREANGHPYQKPLSVMRWLIAKTRARLIIDPYCGSGTTGEAAVIEGRDFIGIDSNADYCRIAEARCLRASGVGVDVPRVGLRRVAAPLFDSMNAPQ